MNPLICNKGQPIKEKENKRFPVKKIVTRAFSSNYRSNFSLMVLYKEEVKLVNDKPLAMKDQVKSSGIDTNRKIVQVNANLFQNNGDTVPD
jgi:hypothetical protein